MSIVHVGVDLAKNVFAVHGVDESGKAALVRPSVSRAKLSELIGVAIAAKNARMAWVVLRRGENFKMPA